MTVRESSVNAEASLIDVLKTELPFIQNVSQYVSPSVGILPLTSLIGSVPFPETMLTGAYLHHHAKSLEICDMICH